MAAPTAPNADLEQSLFKAKQKEMRLRFRAILAAIVPVIIGGLWLVYSLSEVTTWQINADEIQKEKIELEKRETDSRKLISDADTKRLAAEALAQAAQESERAAKERAEAVQQHIIKVREEIGSLNPLLADLNAAKLKATRLMNSEPVESQITEIRSALAKSLGRIELAIDKDLPPAEQKPRVYLFVMDDVQAALAKTLTPVLKGAGFDVPPVVKNTTRRVDSTEVRYFHEPQDKAEAAKILDLIAAQTGQTDIKAYASADADRVNGIRKFEVWLGKLPPAASGPRRE